MEKFSSREILGKREGQTLSAIAVAAILAFATTGMYGLGNIQNASATSAQISTDQDDYAVGDTVLITGTGFLPESQINLSITHPDNGVVSWTAMSGGNGSFDTTYQLDAFAETYTLTATDGTNTAQTTFTDLPKIAGLIDPVPTGQSTSPVVAGSPTSYGLRVLRNTATPAGNGVFDVSASVVSTTLPLTPTTSTVPSPISFTNPNRLLEQSKDFTLNVTPNSSTPTGIYSITVRASRVGAETTDFADLTLSINVLVSNTAPSITVNDITLEGDTTGGRTLVFADIGTASDAEDAGNVPAGGIVCTPAISSVLPLGPNSVSCTATDGGGLTATDSGTVTVQDTTAPTLSGVSGNIQLEGDTIGGYSSVTWPSPTASDIVDPSPTVSCLPASGSFFPLGSTIVSCTASDASTNTSPAQTFTVTVEDTTAPTVTDDTYTVEGNTTGGANIASLPDLVASDIVDSAVSAAECGPGGFFPLGSTPVTCSVTDASGNTGTGTLTVVVQDTTAPTLTLPSNIVTSASGISGKVVTFTATATDIVDGSVPVTCVPASGFTFPIGTTTVNCHATDAHSNTANGSFTVTVTVQYTGFYQPVDMSGVLNTVKAGSTVPLKFEVFGDKTMPSTEITDTSIVKFIKQKLVSCDPSAPTDEVETTATGGTVLRYDITSGQFIYNWKTPTQKGCYTTTLTLMDDSTIQALFKLK